MLSFFSEITRHSHSALTAATTFRAGRMAGSIGHAVDTLLADISGAKLPDSLPNKPSFQDDVNLFVEEFWDDDFFGTHPGRHYKSFPHFQMSKTIENPEKLKQKLITYSKKIQRSRNIKA